jgi:hypothetical protein
LSAIGARVVDAARALAEPAPPRPQATAPAVGAQGHRGDPGLAADKEALATSIRNAPTIKLGQVAAAYGLDIQTKSPTWSLVSQRTQRPANPTIKITFGRDGRVVRAEFAKDGARTYGTGSTEVDEPLLSAVYAWTARGKRLAELASQDPNGEVTIIIRVLLVG